MKTAVISFTQNGNACNRRIITGLKMAGYTTEGFYGGRYKENDSLAKEILRPAAKKVAEWTKDAFEKYDAIVFVGATAIAVRSIAPCLKDKLTDPAVLVVDEKVSMSFRYFQVMWEEPMHWQSSWQRICRQYLLSQLRPIFRVCLPSMCLQ